MRLLEQTLPPLNRLVPPGHVLITATLVVGLAGLEMLGRRAGNDLHDALAGFTLLSLIGLVVSWHRKTPLQWVNWITDRARGMIDRLEPLRYDHGLDLRGTPEFPRRLPPAVWGILGLLGVWAAFAGIAWIVAPTGWRALGLRSSYVLYLFALFTVWSGLLICILVGLYVPKLLLDRRFRGTMRESDRRGLELLMLAMYVLTMTAVAWVVPTVVVLGLCLTAAAVAIWFVVQPQHNEPAILWRVNAQSPIFAVPLRRVVAGMLGVGLLIVFNLLLTSCGGHLFTQPTADDPMPITATLGTMAAWMIPGLLLVGGVRLISGRKLDPSFRTPPTVNLQNTLDAEALAQALAAIRAWGWRFRVAKIGAKLRLGEVGTQLVSPEKSEAGEFDPVWPLKLGVNDYSNVDVKDRLKRRDEILLRRHAFRGMESLMKRAVAERETKGGGYWFAPHWWFLTGLDREEPQRGRVDRSRVPKQVGPPFHKLFGPRVRQHFHELLRAVQVDMIFIEDGVNHRTVLRVVRRLFELYDRTAGERPADDHIFSGLPKVRVVIHDYTPEKPTKVNTFRETHFDELSRARVLHIFRDSGGEEAPIDEPFDFSFEPSPVLSMG